MSEPRAYGSSVLVAPPYAPRGALDAVGHGVVTACAVAAPLCDTDQVLISCGDGYHYRLSCPDARPFMGYVGREHRIDFEATGVRVHIAEDRQLATGRLARARIGVVAIEWSEDPDMEPDE